MNENYKCVAPDIDRLVNCFERHMNPAPPTVTILPHLDGLFDALSDLAPLKKNEEVKAIWITVPRGMIADYGDYEEMKAYGEVESREEYERLWNMEYPNEESWYEVAIVEEYSKDGALRYRGVSINNNLVISALMDEKPTEPDRRMGDLPETLLALILEPVKKSMNLLRHNAYNSLVQNALPYQFKTGVIRRADLWKHEPDDKKSDQYGLSDGTIEAFRKLMVSGKMMKAGLDASGSSRPTTSFAPARLVTRPVEKIWRG